MRDTLSDGPGAGVGTVVAVGTVGGSGTATAAAPSAAHVEKLQSKRSNLG